MKLKKLYAPNKKFKSEAKKAFLRAFKVEYGVKKIQLSLVLGYLFKGVTSAVVAIVLLTGAAVYADQKNVGPESIFYPLKRAQESLRLIFVNASEKPQLHLEFAERRLGEIKQIKEENPRSSRVQGLVEDFRNEVRHSVVTIEYSHPSPEEVVFDAFPTQAQPESMELSFPTTQATPATTSDTSESIHQTGPGVATPQEPEGKLNVLLEKNMIMTHPGANENKAKLIKNKICESWDIIINQQDVEVRGLILGDNPNLFQKFRNKCFSEE